MTEPNEDLNGIIYNITTHVSHQVCDLWKSWMLEKHIPDIMGKGCFIKYQFVRIFDTDETEGFTYATQFYANTNSQLKNYINLYAAELRDEALNKWGNKIISFRSTMGIISIG